MVSQESVFIPSFLQENQIVHKINWCAVHSIYHHLRNHNSKHEVCYQFATINCQIDGYRAKIIFCLALL